MQYIDRCIEDFVRLSRQAFMAKYASPMLVFSPSGDRVEAGGGFDFRATQLLRLAGHGRSLEAAHAAALVAAVKKRPGSLGRQISVGRTQATDVCLNSQDVSTMHAYFSLSGESGYTLTDVGSTNGTRVAGAPLAANTPCPVVNATRVAFATHEAVFYSSEGFYRWVQRCAAEVRASSRLG